MSGDSTLLTEVDGRAVAADPTLLAPRPGAGTTRSDAESPGDADLATPPDATTPATETVGAGQTKTEQPPGPSVPKYLIIADELRTQIMSGALTPGARLPGENDLIRRHGVARMTARQALAVLQSEGLTVARRGAGVFVRDFRPIRRRMVDVPRRPGGERPVDDPLLPSAGAAGHASTAPLATWQVRSPFPTRDDGRDLTVDQVEVRADTASAVVGGALGIPTGAAVWVRSRRLVLDRKVVALAASYLPAEIVDGTGITQTDAGPGGVYARLTELGHAPARFTEELRARMPLRREATELKLPAGTAVIVLCRTTFDAAGRPIEFTKLTLDADAHVLEYTVDAR